MELKTSVITHWKTVAMRPTSLNAPIGDGDSSEFSDIIGDESARTPFENITDVQLKRDVEQFIDHLDERERSILVHRFGLRGATEETLETVGKRFDITRERVRQIQNVAVRKLRNMMFELDETNLDAAAVLTEHTA